MYKTQLSFDGKPLRSLLEEKPIAWSRVVALRAALRALPLTAGGHAAALKIGPRKWLLFAAVRASLVAWILADETFDVTTTAPSYAARAAVRAAGRAGAAHDAARAAAAVAAAVRTAGANAAKTAGARNAAHAVWRAIEALDGGGAHPDDGAVMAAEVNADVSSLLAGASPEELLGRQLWRDTPRRILTAWNDIAQNAELAAFGFHLWIRWYEIATGWDGAPSRNYFADRVGRRVVLQPSEWWNRGIVAVNADIARWLAEEEGRLASPFLVGGARRNRERQGERHIVCLPDAALTEMTLQYLRPDAGAAIFHHARSDPLMVVGRFFADEIEALSSRGGVFHPSIRLSHCGDDFAETDDQSLAHFADTRASASLKGLCLHDVLNDVRAPQAWSRTTGAGATIVVIDSGVSYGLREISSDRRSAVDIGGEYQTKQWIDSNGHGSMCAAIAAGSKRDGGKYNGVAPGAKVLSARTSFRTDDLAIIYDNLYAAHIDGVMKGPVVVSNSYGFDSCSPPALNNVKPLLNTIKIATEKGIPFVFAAGNNHAGKCQSQPEDHRPSSIWGMNSLECVLTVGAVGKMDGAFTNQHRDLPHSMSSRGPCQWDDSYLKPDCVAPCYGEVPRGEGYQRKVWWGTSGAAAQAAGLAALLLSIKPDLTPLKLWDIMRDSAEPLNRHVYCVGKGMINCKEAIARI